MPAKIHISADGQFCDKDGNEIQLRGVNLDPSVKIPAKPFLSTHAPIENDTFFEDADKVSFINHPLVLDDIEQHIIRLKSLGYNTIRLPFTWESLEHAGPGQYDFDYMDYIVEVLTRINSVQQGMYIYLDPHQDVWSRFSGGSGAPLWTLYCAGFQPANFLATDAAILHNYYIDPKTGREVGKDEESYPKMVWPTNYFKLACQTMFTLFFGGKQYAPKCTINGENIQDYLQGRFNDAIMTLCARIKEKAPELFESNCIIGLESMNEPNCGYIGETNLDVIPKERNLKLGKTPTAFQSFMLGEGIECTIDQYKRTFFGFSKGKPCTINPKGKKAWLSAEERDAIDAKYNWERNPEWKPDTCIWKLHGVWEIQNGKRPVLLKPNYFSQPDATVFMNNHFVDYYTGIYNKFREFDQELFIIIQPPVMKPPPNLQNSKILDNRTICACHFYDGMTLMYKTWNKRIGIDTYGLVNKKYSNPAFAVVLGENNIRKCIRKQLSEMQKDAKSMLGKKVPVFFTEIGIPFDMDDKKAYITNDYSSQTAALDALGFALEGSNLSYTLWCYCSINSHIWGDNWNNEDFSIWSPDDKPLYHDTRAKTPTPEPSPASTVASVSTSTSKSGSSQPPSFIKPDNHLDLDSPSCTLKSDLSGFRALDAIMRPFPIKIHGRFEFAEFNLCNKSYLLKLVGKTTPEQITVPTYIFIPRHHFTPSRLSIRSSSGHYTYNTDYQVLEWFHEPGHQFIEICAKSKSRPNTPGSDTSNDLPAECVIS
ncbi:BBT_HP_G0010200.mRNA.1.CDS.1 [Saccharomyces cerevisiae]|nr:BBT_HP_G0053550.mRNA.1.CDS.1 [Saccharomyces cerevisiae]CAI5206200.1 BBT_HP_G0010200.mRNA.1.CDS.1 [Saccharomyces cerevisiae]CAI6693925.1 BBT_HP_G0053550.mRNA.1.CDS.1 [Saccharomyces cerevisiae]CAI7010833.1 BBT_HP_G0010200.mRNA.1.CDS.1 [Saccharomyces cerevisiae]CAI7095929.1 BBT_collapsed_G0027740.mRNA.1.CDS.1 [Saccharomyces cerevisiae]